MKKILLLTLLGSLIVSGCGKEETETIDNDHIEDQEKSADSKDDDSKKSAGKNSEEKEDVVVEKDESALDKGDKDDENEKADSIEDVAEELAGLHGFIVKDDQWYNEKVKELKNKGIVLNGDYSSPYTKYAKAKGETQYHVLMGVLLEKENIQKESDAKGSITYNFQAGIVHGTNNETISDAPNHEKYFRDGLEGENVKVTYHVEKKGNQWNVTRDGGKWEGF
ncbi:hypothetical protein MTQ93_09630 [Staphylococcus agnetis]|uniref:hypothetical protein n=1 Tax=Staphylococcus agnetis TaxID=985762 RepID=UPI00208F71E7|nr:hypothetical protein [Staphylococcus agnetis]MCO4346304.1 hypothetical protein [Staphylococcus agnetis]MCO4360620.1 hypothetical protein [Staphylococcus agnetis]